jgi:hypothetical protein
MSGDGESRRIFLGCYEGGTTHVVVPREILQSADQKLAADRAAREAAAEKAKLQVLQSARNQGRLRRALHAVFRRRIPR